MDNQKGEARREASFDTKVSSSASPRKVTGWTRVGELLSERIAAAVAKGEIKRIGKPYCERPEFIEYWLSGHVAEYKEVDAWITELEKILSAERVRAEDTIEQWYLAYLDGTKQRREKIRHRIKWLGKCHDKATGRKRFATAPRKLPSFHGKLDKDTIKQNADIVEIISGYTELKKAGRNFKGRCPLHQEKTPSFYVDPAKGWYCHGCHQGGDVFAFVQQAEGVSFPEAVKRVGGDV